MQENNKSVEKETRLSQSILWELQRDYFDREGLNAWNGQVPFFVTSNTFVANVYAQMLVHFFQDWIQLHPEATKAPFYILELGTGTGQLSFYVIKRLKELLAERKLSAISFIYVMSDFTQSNLDFYQSQPELQAFLKEKILDFALYNMEEEKEIRLVNQGTVLSPKTLVNPLTLFGNYIFDTIAHDCFAVKEGALFEAQVNIHTDSSNLKDDQVISMDKLNILFSEAAITLPYYDESVLNELLEHYRQSLTDSKFLIPISSIRALARLRALSNDRLMLISSDKGYSAVEQLEHLNYPHISFHGSFSMMVNFHAIAEYFARTGGDYVLQTQRKGIKTSLFFSGINLCDLPQTQAAANQYINGFSPADYFIIHRYISDTYHTAKLDTLSSHLVLTCFDPYMYNRLHERINQLIPETDTATIEHLLQSMARIADNFYYMPSAHDVLFDIAFVHQALKKYGQAVAYYERSMSLFGKQFGVIYNLGICLYHQGRYKESLHYFKDARKLDGHNEYSKSLKEWIDQLYTLVS